GRVAERRSGTAPDQPPKQNHDAERSPWRSWSWRYGRRSKRTGKWGLFEVHLPHSYIVGDDASPLRYPAGASASTILAMKTQRGVHHVFFPGDAYACCRRLFAGLLSDCHTSAGRPAL